MHNLCFNACKMNSVRVELSCNFNINLLKKHIYKMKIEKKNRPMSPHLTIYKPQISSVLSIGHRISGAGLFVALFMLSLWFICFGFSGGDVEHFVFFDCFIVKIILYIASYGYFYHFCMGVRHLFWDAGYGFEIKDVHMSGIVAIIISILMTALFWVLIT